MEHFLYVYDIREWCLMQSMKMYHIFNAIEHISFGVTLIKTTLDSILGRIKIFHLRNESCFRKKRNENGSLSHTA